MSTNTIYFGENEKTLGFTTLVAKLIKGRISCLYTVQPPTTTVHALRAPLWPGLWSAWRGVAGARAFTRSPAFAGTRRAANAA